MFLELVFNQSDRKLCRVDRHIDFLQNIRERSNMILMPMSDHESLHFLNIIFQIRNIRNDKIDSQHIILRKRQSAVHNNNTVFILESSNIHSDLFKTAERNDLSFTCIILFQKAPPSGRVLPLLFFRTQRNLLFFKLHIIVKHLGKHSGHSFELNLVLHHNIFAFLIAAG